MTNSEVIGIDNSGKSPILNIKNGENEVKFRFRNSTICNWC